MESTLSKRWGVLIAALAILVAGILAYSNSFSGPFIFDDVESIRNNPRIHSLWTSLSPQPGESLVGRPVAQFSFAVNYALNDLGVRGYHTVNLVIHLLAGLALFGIARRTLLTPPMREKFGGHATILGAVIGLIWLVHPLQTESVTYLVQRDESLMGLFFFLTLYCAIRGSETNGKGWFVAAVTCCALGMATKERMAVAPLMVLLYDRTFLSGSFASALRRRTVLYVALALTWVVLIGLMTLSPTSSAIGFGCGVSEMDWLRHQVISVTHYLWLSFCPYPLILDYGHPAPPTFAQMFLPGVVLLALLAATGVALVRRPTWGFLGAWFFVTLAPTASFVPIGEFEVEHWMYVPLAGVVAVVVMGAYLFLSRAQKAGSDSRGGVTMREWVGLGMAAACVVTLAITTYARNDQYGSTVKIWDDTVHKSPLAWRAYVAYGAALIDEDKANYIKASKWLNEAIQHDPQQVAPAYNELGRGLLEQGRFADSLPYFAKAIEADSHYMIAYRNAGAALVGVGRLDDAVKLLNTSIQIDPNHAAGAYTSLGVALMRVGRYADAVEIFNEALKRDEHYAKAYGSLGNALLGLGRFDEAVASFKKGMELDASMAPALYGDLGNAYAGLGRLDDAIVCYREAIRLNPATPANYSNLGRALSLEGRLDEAIQCLHDAIERNPNYADAYNNLGGAYLQKGKFEDAIKCFDLAIHLNPNDAKAFNNLGQALIQTGRWADAISYLRQSMVLDARYAAVANNDIGRCQSLLGLTADSLASFREAIRLEPRFAVAYNNMGTVFVKSGNIDNGIACFRQAIRIDPRYPMAYYDLGTTLVGTGQADDGVAELKKALSLVPDYPIFLDKLASVYATNPDPKVRNAAEAVRMAEKACELTKDGNAATLDTLAAAYAEAGQFEKAVKTAKKAVDVATAAGQKPLADSIGEHLKSFEAGKPWYEAPKP